MVQTCLEFGCQRQYGLHFCQLLSVCGVSDVKQTEIHTAEPLVPLPSAFGIETAIENVKRCKS
jgi:hypothetical protein